MTTDSQDGYEDDEPERPVRPLSGADAAALAEIELDLGRPLREGAPTGCLVCGTFIEQPVSGRTRLYCSQLCRQQMARVGKAGAKFLRQADAGGEGAPAVPVGLDLAAEIAQNAARGAQLAAALERQTKTTEPSRVRAALAAADSAKVTAEAEAEALRVSLQAANEFVEASAEELTQVQAAAEEEHAQLEDELEDARQKAEDDRIRLTGVIDTAHADLEQVRGQLVMQVDRTGRAEATAAERATRIEELDRAVEALRGMVTDAKALAAAAESAKEAALAAASDSKQRAAEAEDARRKTELDKAELVTKVAELEMELAAARADAGTQRQRAQDAESALAREQDALRRVEQVAGQRATEIEQLGNQLTAEQQARQVDQETAAAAARAAAAAAAAAAEKVTALETRLAVQTATSDAEIAGMRGENQRLTQELGRLTGERDQAVRAQTTAETELAQQRRAGRQDQAGPDTGSKPRKG